MITAECVRSTMVDQYKVDQLISILEGEIVNSAKIGLSELVKNFNSSEYSSKDLEKVILVLKNSGFCVKDSFKNIGGSLFCFCIKW